MAEWRRNEHSLGPAPQILQDSQAVTDLILPPQLREKVST